MSLCTSHCAQRRYTKTRQNPSLEELTIWPGSLASTHLIPNEIIAVIWLSALHPGSGKSWQNGSSEWHWGGEEKNSHNHHIVKLFLIKLLSSSWNPLQRRNGSFDGWKSVKGERRCIGGLESEDWAIWRWGRGEKVDKEIGSRQGDRKMLRQASLALKLWLGLVVSKL